MAPVGGSLPRLYHRPGQGQRASRSRAFLKPKEFNGRLPNSHDFYNSYSDFFPLLGKPRSSQNFDEANLPLPLRFWGSCG